VVFVDFKQTVTVADRTVLCGATVLNSAFKEAQGKALCNTTLYVGAAGNKPFNTSDACWAAVNSTEVRCLENNRRSLLSSSSLAKLDEPANDNMIKPPTSLLGGSSSKDTKKANAGLHKEASSSLLQEKEEKNRHLQTTTSTSVVLQTTIGFRVLASLASSQASIDAWSPAAGVPIISHLLSQLVKA